MFSEDKDERAKMHNPKIDQVFWYQTRNSMVVTYRDGKPDRTNDTQAAASKLADTEGLTQVPSREGISRWVRNPQSTRRTWHLETSTLEAAILRTATLTKLRLRSGQRGSRNTHLLP
jgi:hypothetical protein